MYFQHCIVRRHWFESDISVPASAGETTDIAELVCESASFLLLLTADDADLISKLAASFCQRVNMKARGRGLWLYKQWLGARGMEVLTQPAASVILSQSSFIC
jgi:hypothetical protein